MHTQNDMFTCLPL